MRGRTTIVITHRMTLAERADRILSLGPDGVVVEDRSPEGLALRARRKGARAF